ncbi:LemA protein [gamma proteobacterium HdN1]|nr:LemA protein [gamma proteobacterium HdN1]
MITTLIILAVVIVLVLWGVSIYNKLISLRNRLKNAFAQIDVQLQRRYDLIPNLVETAKKYMQHEKETLTAVIAARNSAITAKDQAASNPDSSSAMRSLSSAESVLGAAMGKFIALSESYPDLKANTTMNQLMEELSSTENRVAFSRQAFNDAVTEYNIYREQVPNNFIAGFGSFQPAEQLQIESPEARKAVKVSFN